MRVRRFIGTDTLANPGNWSDLCNAESYRVLDQNCSLRLLVVTRSTVRSNGERKEENKTTETISFHT